ncbi:MAG: transcription initiation factor IIB, partial [Candidatus Thorarchaeota archaeon]
FSKPLKLRETTTIAAEKLANRTEEKFLNSGKKLIGTAAAIIYISSILEEDRRTQKEISKVANVPESTIRNRYLEIVRSLEIRKEK